jgi:hypothetical protein
MGIAASLMGIAASLMGIAASLMGIAASFTGLVRIQSAEWSAATLTNRQITLEITRLEPLMHLITTERTLDDALRIGIKPWSVMVVVIIIVSAVIVAAVVDASVVVVAVITVSTVVVAAVVDALAVVVAAVVDASAVVVAGITVSAVVVAAVVDASAVVVAAVVNASVVVVLVVGLFPRESLRHILLPRDASYGLVGRVHLHTNIGKKIDVANDWRIILLHANIKSREQITDLCPCIISPPPGELRGATVELRKVPPKSHQSAFGVILAEYHIDGHGGRARRLLNLPRVLIPFVVQVQRTVHFSLLK